MNTKLPIYELQIGEDEEVGVTCISLVDMPAIEKNWQMFNSQNFVEPKSGESERDFLSRCIPVYINEGKPSDQAIAICYNVWEKKGFSKFKASDKEKQIVSGAAMIANLPIYRRDKARGEYYVIFSPETIEKIAHRFFKKGFNTTANIQHANQVDGVYIVESFIIDSKRGILTPKGYDELPDGSWFVSMKVDNPTMWNSFIKTGVLNGFSVEGTFIEAHLGDAEDEVIKKIIEIFS